MREKNFYEILSKDHYDSTLEIKEKFHLKMISNYASFAKLWKIFFEFELKIFVGPNYQPHLIPRREVKLQR